MTKKYYGGCDVGSTTGKVVILDENGNMVVSIIVLSNVLANGFYIDISVKFS